MKRIFIFIVSAIAFAFLISSCGNKKNVVEITGLTTYNDAAANFSIQYPTNWTSSNTIGERFVSFTNKEATRRFKTFDPEGVAGAKIDMQAIKLKEGQTLDTIMNFKQFEPGIYSKPIEVTIDGIKAMKQTYEFPLTDGKFQGEIYYAMKDPTIVTIVSFEAFADLFDTYKDKFAEILKTVKLAKMADAKSDTLKKEVQADPPSAKLTNYKGDGFTMQVPDNFDVKNPKTTAIKSYKFEGMRRGDCYMLIDVFDATKQNKLDKIVADNKGKYNTEPKATNVSGQKAFVFEYAASAQIQRKVYFAVNGNKLFRITVDYNKTEDADLFKPVFDKSIATFKFQ
jgi:major membrane immunogen (membrane-anchored lipoprotein)